MSLEYIKFVYSNEEDVTQVMAIVQDVADNFPGAAADNMWEKFDNGQVGIAIDCEDAATAKKFHDAICEKLNHSGLTWDIDAEWETV